MHLRKRCFMFLACTTELQLDKKSSRVLRKRSHDKDLRYTGIGLSRSKQTCPDGEGGSKYGYQNKTRNMWG